MGVGLPLLPSWRPKSTQKKKMMTPGGKQPCPQGLVFGIVCKVRTQDPENFDEEVKSLLTACHSLL